MSRLPKRSARAELLIVPTAEEENELRAFARQLESLARELERVRERLDPLLESRTDVPTFTVRGIRALEAVERDYVQFVLRYQDGNKTKTAAALGVDVSTLHRKLARWTED